MIALLQRVTEATVTVGDRIVGAIGPGLLCFAGAESGDDESLVDRLVAKVLSLRVFADDAGKMNLDLGLGAAARIRGSPPVNSAPT